MVSIFAHTHLYTAYVDDPTFFLENLTSVKKLLNTIETFSPFSSTKPNLSKCEISRIGALEGPQWQSVE